MREVGYGETIDCERSRASSARRPRADRLEGALAESRNADARHCTRPMDTAPARVEDLADEVTSGIDDHGVWWAFVRHGIVDA